MPDLKKRHSFHEVCDPNEGIVQKAVQSPVFDYAMGLVIIINMIIIVLETDVAAARDQTVPVWIKVAGWMVLIIFAAELIVKLVIFRWSFFSDHWKIFDFTVVLTDGIFSLCGIIFGEVFPVSTLRCFRLCKLARVSKVFRVFPELRLMMAGLAGSIRAIFWGTVLLTFVLLVWAIIAVQFIHPLNRELAESGLLNDCERCPRAYQSVFDATLTFTQQIVTGDSWGQATIPVIEHYPITAFYFMGVFLSVGMAVLNLILGVVVNVAQNSHDNLKAEMDNDIMIAKMEAHNHLHKMCVDMDADKSGELSKDEVFNGFHENPEFRECILSMDLEEEDLQIVWGIVDADKSGAASYDEFVTQIYKLKSSDVTFMLAYIKYYIIIIKDKICDMIQKEQASIVERDAKMEAEIEKVEADELAFIAEIREEEQAAKSMLATMANSLSRTSPPMAGEQEVVMTTALIKNARETTGGDGISARGSQMTDKGGNSSYELLKEVLDQSREFLMEWRKTSAQLLCEVSSLQPRVGGNLLTLPSSRNASPFIMPRDDFAARAPPSIVNGTGNDNG